MKKACIPVHKDGVEQPLFQYWDEVDTHLLHYPVLACVIHAAKAFCECFWGGILH